MPVFDGDDFSFSTEWEDENTVKIYHFEVNPALEGNNLGSAILETLKRVYAFEGASTIKIRMGGGNRAEQFLERNDFMITKREYVDQNDIRGEYLVTAKHEYPDYPTN